MIHDEKITLVIVTVVAAIFCFGVFYGSYKVIEYDRNKMLAFVAKCESNGNHAVMQRVDRGACYKGKAPALIERYNYEFK